jgi:aspartate/methionine/tyrosine aminotransferase
VPGVSCATPEATFYLFPNVTTAVERLGFASVSEFATAALHQTGVSFCTRHHFGTAQTDETERYIRLAYSGISVDAIEEGLGALASWVGSA